MINRKEEDIIKEWKHDIKKPLISICTITYNHEDYIETALDSFLMQETEFPFEIVIDDDASTDKTPEIIEKYVKKYPKIINANLRKKNVGSVKNFFENMQRASGQYIALCEGDDCWLDKLKLQEQYSIMKQNPSYSMSFHPSKLIMNKTLTNQITAYQADETKVIKTDSIIKGSGSFCPTSSLMFKRNIVSNLPTWVMEAPVGDYFLQVIGSTPNGILYFNKVMSAYRINTSGSWSSSMQKMETQKLFFTKMVNSLYLLDSYLDHRYSQEILDMIILRYWIMAKLYLDNKHYKQFQELIQEIKNIKKSGFGLEEKVYIKLRKFPSLLRFIYKNSWLLDGPKKVYQKIKYLLK